MRVRLLSFAILTGLTIRSDAEPLIFDGRIEAIDRAQIYSRAEGRVTEVYATAGMRVEAGTVLARLESDLAELAVEAAEAELARQSALLRQAEDRLARAGRLAQSGSSSAVALFNAETDMQLAEASLRAADVALKRAKVGLGDTAIRATQDGIIDSVAVGVGALLEFDAGMPPLFEIIDMDPVRVVYQVPYAERLSQLARLDLTRTEDLFARVKADLTLADGTVLAQNITPQATSVRVDPETGTVQVWAEVANPDAVLRPGMQVTVRSFVTGAEQEGSKQ